MKIVHIDDIEEKEGRYPPPFDREGLAFGRNVGAAAQTRTLGAWRDRLPPGRRTSFTHAHLREEELVFVLEGTPSVRWIDPGQEPREETLRPGSIVSFPAGTGVAHTFVNRGGGDAVLLVIGERRPGERIAYAEDAEFAAWLAHRATDRVWDDRDGPSKDARAPAYRIRTERLELRPWALTDARRLRNLVGRNHAHLKPWMPWAQEVPSVDAQLDVIRRSRARYDLGEDFVLGAFRTDTGKPIGGTGLHLRIGQGAAEIGYWVDHEHQGQGYVTEWVAGLVRVGLGPHGYGRIEIHCDPANTRSSAIPERLGFTLEGVRRKVGVDVRGRPRDTMIWTLLADELADTPCATADVQAWDALGRRLL